MTDITTRAGKGAPLTHDELDQNFLNLQETADLAYAASASLGGKANAAALGTDAAATDLGAFTSDLITDGTTAKGALQELATAIETTSGSAAIKVNAVAVGVAPTDANMGTPPSAIFTANGTVKDWFGEAGAAIEDLTSFVERITITPIQFGAVGDGVADDADALNAMFDYARDLIAASSFTAVCVNGGNGVYRTTESLNVTSIAAWSLTVRDLYVRGECTGKAVIDLIGTRGYVFDNVTVWGDKTNRPAVGIQAQRGVSTGFCDNAAFRDCNIDGWFSTAAVHDYGQETTQWVHCTIFNRDHTGRVAIHTGYSTDTMTSDYASVMTGGTSFINKQFLNCDYRYLPADENIVSITGISSAANAVITAAGHAFEIGDEVVFQYVAGMPAMSSRIATVSAKTATTFTVNVDTTAMPSFGGSGNAIRRATKSPIYIARTEGFAMHDCYVVSYGRVPIEVGFPDPAFPRVEQLSFPNMLFEGSGHTAEIGFSPTATATVQGFELSTYNTHSHVSLLENLNPTYIVSFYGFDVRAVDPLFTIALSDNPAKMAAYDARILFGSLALVAPETWAAFNGQITSFLTGKNTLIVTDEIRLNAGRMRIGGTFGSGAATPTLGTNKPGSNAAPATWADITIDGTVYCIPVWPK